MNYKTALKPTLFLLGLTLAQCTTSMAAFGRNKSLKGNTIAASKEDHLQWLMFSHTDFKAAQLLAQSDDLVAPALYHIQQCVEKALKAYLVLKNIAIPRTHNLTELLNACSSADKSFESIKNTSKSLSSYATITRYPNSRFEKLTVTTLQVAMQQALDILANIKTKMQEVMNLEEVLKPEKAPNLTITDMDIDVNNQELIPTIP